ncbi:MAG TPA: SlyX family protein [Pirellulales bacterium]|nr:SlyX family protein [Pirellulales bacterium]
MNEQLAHLVDRLVRLETVVTHLEQTLSDLNEMVLLNAKQFDAAQRQIAALTHQLSQLREPAAEPRKPEDEKPPHY